MTAQRPMAGWLARGQERREEAELRRADIVALLRRRPNLTAMEIADAVTAALDVTRRDLVFMERGGAVVRERAPAVHPTVRLFRWRLA